MRAIPQSWLAAFAPPMRVAMKFEYVGKKENTHAYGIRAGIYPGSVIELDGHMATKANANPDFKKVNGNKKVTITPEEGERLAEEQERKRRLENPLAQSIAALERQLQDLKDQQITREEEGLSVDDVFMDPAEIDD